MRLIKNVSKDISEYGFLKLLVSTMIIKEQVPCFYNHKLQKDLVMFYDDSDFSHLFQDIIIRRDKILPENSYVDLNESFQTAYAWGLLSIIHDHDELKSFINISKKEAIEGIRTFSIKQIESMDKLCSILINKDIVEKKNKLIKK